MLIVSTVLSQTNCPSKFKCKGTNYYLYSEIQVIGIANKFIELGMVTEQRDTLLVLNNRLRDVKRDLEHKVSTLEESVVICKKNLEYKDREISYHEIQGSIFRSEIKKQKKYRNILIASTLFISIIAIAK